jgi:hypothetical protein
MSAITRCSTAVDPGFLLIDDIPPDLSQRIEPFELQSTVITKKLLKSGEPKNDQGVVVPTLYS